MACYELAQRSLMLEAEVREHAQKVKRAEREEATYRAVREAAQTEHGIAESALLGCKRELSRILEQKAVVPRAWWWLPTGPLRCEPSVWESERGTTSVWSGSAGARLVEKSPQAEWRARCCTLPDGAVITGLLWIWRARTRQIQPRKRPQLLPRATRARRNRIFFCTDERVAAEDGSELLERECHLLIMLPTGREPSPSSWQSLGARDRARAQQLARSMPPDARCRIFWRHARPADTTEGRPPAITQRVVELLLRPVAEIRSQSLA